jgi:alpha-galactosidase
MPRIAILGVTAVTLAFAASPASALDNGLARTPPMGWNSWYTAHCGVTEDMVMRNARALVDSGLAARGYLYVNVDGCWEDLKRDADGDLRGNRETFPSGMRELGRRIHALGLKFGIYTSAGPRICSHPHPGSMDHYRQDMKRFASWRVDYVKVDWCNVPDGMDARKVYARVARAAAGSGRRMLVTVSTPGVDDPWRWASAYGNTWRISADADGTWKGVLRSLDVDAPLHRYAGPGGWNDPDMLQVGGGGLSPDEERAHFSLWSMLAAPLLAGYGVTSATPDTLAVLGNDDVIAIDQDRRGRQGRRLRRRHGVEVWVRPLAHRAVAVLLFNRSGGAREAKIALGDVPGLRDAARYQVRDLWAHSTTTLEADGVLRAEIPRHGAAMWRVRPKS